MNCLINNDFKESFPWRGGDLQTIRDTFCFEFKFSENIHKIFIPVKNVFSNKITCDYLLGYLQEPKEQNLTKGLIVVTHGLGGSTSRFGLKRISKKLIDQGFAVLKLNLRGAGPGRYLSQSNYSARCSNDIISVVSYLRTNLSREILCSNFDEKYFPIYGVGLSLGGTIFLNACFDYDSQHQKTLFDGLACVSSPIDLSSCSECIDKPRNYLYQKWLINRLKRQVLNSELTKIEIFKDKFTKNSINKIKTIREFDEKITAPSWGYKSVDDYYFQASPLLRIKTANDKLPPCLFIHAKDDPWVPYEPLLELKNILKTENKDLKIFITEKGGHNGFHSSLGCWSDEVVSNWIKLLSN